jgi:O-antigen/teichoic acid export membrane protein
MTLRPLLADLRKVSFGNREASVIRRSLWVTFFFLLGHLCYYCLIVLANRQLTPADFGRFYTGWTILNILFAPGAIFVLLLSGYFATAFRSGHQAAVLAALWQTARQIAAPTALVVLLCEGGLILGGRVFGIDAFSLASLLPLTAVMSFMVEVLRAAYQGQMQFTRYGIYWTAWCGLQLLLGAVGIFLFKAPWAVFAGMLAANVVFLALLAVNLQRQVPAGGLPEWHERLTLKQFLPLCGSLVGSVILINIDVLVAYLTFSPAVNGVYAASAFLSKVIITATQPIVQIMIPLIAHADSGSTGRQRLVTLKAIGVGAVFALSGAIFLWLGAAQVCGGSYGVKYCDIPVMDLLALSAIPLTIVRVWLIVDVAYKQYRVAQLMYGAVAIFVAFALTHSPGALSLAVIYCLCCWGALAVRGFLQLLSMLGASRRHL